MAGRRDEALMEAAAAAHRTRDRDGSIQFHPSWCDLDEEGRRAAFAITVVTRALEAALAPDGLSTTARAVMSRVRDEP